MCFISLQVVRRRGGTWVVAMSAHDGEKQRRKAGIKEELVAAHSKQIV
jgi:hypothetical protein